MNYYNDYESTLGGIIGGFAIIFVILGLLLIAYAVVAIIASWRLYKKAGKSGWECIVPIYSYWVLCEIAGINWWWFLLAICDSIVSLIGLEDLEAVANLVSIFASFNIYYNIAKKFGKDGGNAVCAGIFSGIFVLIFGFSKNETYNASIPVSKNGIFGTPETNGVNTNNYQNSNVKDNIVNDEVSQEYSFCANCGTKVNKDVRFCPNCGKENI